MWDWLEEFLNNGGGEAAAEGASAATDTGGGNWDEALSLFFGGDEPLSAAAPAAVGSSDPSSVDYTNWMDRASDAAPAGEASVESFFNPVAPAAKMWNDTKGWLDRAASGDKKTLGQARLALGGLGFLNSLLESRRKRPRGYLSPAEMQAQLKSPYSNWTPEQQRNFNNYFYRPLPQFTYKPPQGLASGGKVDGCGCGGLNALARGGQPQRFVTGDSGGQDDKVSAKLSPGEYVFDADVVSALGDGNNAAGARLLDEMRANIRRHKRSAPASKIPPRAKPLGSYLPKKKV